MLTSPKPLEQLLKNGLRKKLPGHIKGKNFTLKLKYFALKKG